MWCDRINGPHPDPLQIHPDATHLATCQRHLAPCKHPMAWDLARHDPRLWVPLSTLSSEPGTEPRKCPPPRGLPSPLNPPIQVHPLDMGLAMRQGDLRENP
jgi:hypothetical protein